MRAGVGRRGESQHRCDIRIAFGIGHCEENSCCVCGGQRSGSIIQHSRDRKAKAPIGVDGKSVT